MQISVLILIKKFETFFKINQKYLSRINEFTSPLNAFEKAYNINGTANLVSHKQICQQPGCLYIQCFVTFVCVIFKVFTWKYGRYEKKNC